MIDQLRADLKRDEGVRFELYRDSVGKVTGGVGHNFDDKGISEAVSNLMLDEDIADAYADLDRNAPWWRDMPDRCQDGLANMSFNMGWPRLSGFKRMLAALQAGDYTKAADEALDSRWAVQVGARANRIATLFREGVAP